MDSDWQSSLASKTLLELFPGFFPVLFPLQIERDTDEVLRISTCSVLPLVGVRKIYKKNVELGLLRCAHVFFFNFSLEERC